MRKPAVESVLIVATLIASFVQPYATGQSQTPQVSAGDAKSHVGQQVTICGRVVTYDCEQSSGSLLLDLDSPNWAAGISVAIGRESWIDFGGEQLVDRFISARVCATGTVERARRRYRLVVRHPSQLQSLSGSANQSAVFAPGAVQSCREGVTPPILIREVKPSYTRDAMSYRIEGRVYLEAVVLADGSVGEVRALYGLEPDYGLNQRAIDAVKQWRFRPGAKDGRSVPTIITAELSFVLRG